VKYFVVLESKSFSDAKSAINYLCVSHVVVWKNVNTTLCANKENFHELLLSSFPFNFDSFFFDFLLSTDKGVFGRDNGFCHKKAKGEQITSLIQTSCFQKCLTNNEVFAYKFDRSRDLF
jgi:hypothetical protein